MPNGCAGVVSADGRFEALNDTTSGGVRRDTRFEARGRAAGRELVRLSYRRVAPQVDTPAALYDTGLLPARR